MSEIVILDVETTGFIEPQPIEVAFLEIEYPSLEVVGEFHQFFKPTKKIDFGAKAVHHIVEEDLEGCELSETYKLPEYPYIIGHNCDFDWKVLGEPNIKRIDTLAIARKILPETDSHTQSALLYFFEGNSARSKLKDAHSALVDVKNCLLVLKYLISYARETSEVKLDTIEKLHQFSEYCRIPDRFSFGKHKDKLISEVKRIDPSYIYNYLLKQPDLDPYLKIALLKR